MSVVEEIKERLDIVEIVGRSVRLHTEKTPSFFVFPDSQRWHCFGCDKGGDVFTFVMEHEGWDFRTALEELGRQAGVELRPLTPAQAQAATEAERLRAALKAATHYYHTLLLTAPQAHGKRLHRGGTGKSRAVGAEG
jgi:DNA primase